MPVKRKGASRTASASNLAAAKMGMAAFTTGQQPHQDTDKGIKKKSASSQAIAHNQPRPFLRSGSTAKMVNKTRQHDEQAEVVVDAPPTDDDGDDWVSSSSAVPSPAPEPDNEEEDAIIYVNQNVRFRPNQPDDTPATPRRSNLPHLPHQRHNPNNVTPNVPDQSALLLGGIHPTVPKRHHDQGYNVPTEPSHIHFAREPAHETHPPDARIHQNGGTVHHFSPPLSTTATISAADEQIQPGSSVIRLSDRPLVDQEASRTENEYPQTNGKQNGGDQNTSGIRRTSAGTKLGQDQIDISTQQGRQIAATHSIRPAVPGNNADANGSAHGHVQEGDIGRTSSQRGFGAAPTTAPAVVLMQPSHQAALDDAQTLPPPLVPAAPISASGVVTTSGPNPVHPRPTPRPSILRRDTTPTAISRSPMAIDTPPRSHTPPASMSHDEAIANNYKRHSIHAPGGHHRPHSLYQPTSQGKRLSLTSRPGSAQYALSQIHGKNNPLALLIRLNTMQGSNLAAPPVVSPSYEHSERDSETGSAYTAMSPTRTRSLRRRTSNSSLNSVATMPIISTTAATARGSSASPTSVLAGSSSALLKNLSSSAHSDPTRADTLRPMNDDKPLFVSQFYPSNGLLPGEKSKRKTGRGLCSLMAGEEDWKCHETAMKHRGLMNESFNRVNIARAAAVAASTGSTKRR